MEENRYQIICQYLDKKLPPDAREELAAWRKTSAENERQFQEVKLLWQQMPYAETEKEAINIDVESALKRVNQQVATTAKVVPLRSKWRTLSAVAAVLLASGIGLWWMFAVPIAMIEVATAANETQKITLPDNSTVWLNENSTLTYPATFAADQRLVKMRGEIAFEVTHNPERPFVVETADVAVKVLGTTFNIRATADAPTVHVLDGKVAVTSIADPTQNIKLTKGMTAVYDKNQQQLDLPNDFSENDLFWFTQTLVFNETPFAQVIQDLNRAYDSQVTFNNNALADCPVRGTFIKKSLPEILATLQLIYGFEIVQNASSTIQLKNGSCQ